MHNPLIIIGAGLAGWTTAREFRKLDTTTPVTVITAGNGDFYAKPSLSNAFNQKRSPEQLVSTPATKMGDTLNVSLLTHTQVEAINPATQSVRTNRGEFAYSNLVLATGAQPIRVPVSGDASEQVLSVNSLDDFSIFYAQLTKAQTSTEGAAGKHVLIMGAGLIGCEFANDLIASGYQVTVVDPSNSPILALLPLGASEQLRDALAALGVTWHFGATVKSVIASVQNGASLQVELSNGFLVPVDTILSAIGLRADAQLARAANLRCERGIVVDAALQTSQPHIFALGDGAQYASAGDRTLPYVMPIMNAAKALAATLTGQRTEVVFPLMPVAIKTPALPIMVAAPAPGTAGDWHQAEDGVWQFITPNGQQLGFVLTGKNTSRRAEQVKLTALATIG